MDLKDLHDMFKRNTELEWSEMTNDGVEGIAIRHTQYNEPVFITFDNLKNITNVELLVALTAGRDIEQITRVTGFFSKVSGWNKGKLAELADRHRNLEWGVENE